MNFWWALLFEVSCWVNGGIIQYEPLDSVMFDKPLAVSIGAEFGYGPVSVYGGVATDMFAVSAFSFSQFFTTYPVGLKIEVGAFVLGFEHSCFHPNVPYQWIPARKNVVPAFEGSMDRIYLKVKLGGKK